MQPLGRAPTAGLDEGSDLASHSDVAGHMALRDSSLLQVKVREGDKREAKLGVKLKTHPDLEFTCHA
jgi:hypothetical protein